MCDHFFGTTCSYPLTFLLNHEVKSKNDPASLAWSDIVGVWPNSLNSEVSNGRMEGQLILLCFSDHGKGCRAWWCSAHPGSCLPNSQREMILSKKPRKRCLWKARNVQQRSYISEFIYKPKSIFKHKLGCSSGQIQHTQIDSLKGWCGYTG